MLFNMFCEIIERVLNLLEKWNTQFCKAVLIIAIPVAICPLATCNYHGTIRETFVVGTLIVISITNDFCCEIVNLIKYFIKSLSTAKAICEIKDKTGCKIPQVVRTKSEVHMEIYGPTMENKVDYYDRKQQHLIKSQAVTRDNLIF